MKNINFNKYLNNAIYGNDNIIASLDEKGKLIRVVLPGSFSSFNYINNHDIYFKIRYNENENFDTNTNANIIDINNCENSYNTNNTFNKNYTNNDYNYNYDNFNKEVFKNNCDGNRDESFTYNYGFNEEKYTRYNQIDVENTNVIKTNIFLEEHNLNIVQTDFSPNINENLLVRRLEITNNNEFEINLTPIITIGINNFNTNSNIGSFLKENSLVLSNDKNIILSYIKDLKINSYKINNNENIIENGNFENFYETEGLSSNSSIEYNEIKIGAYQKYTIDMFLLFENMLVKKNRIFNQSYINSKKEIFKELDLEKLEDNIIKSDRNYIQSRINYMLSKDSNLIKELNNKIERYNNLPYNYKMVLEKSIILLKLLTNGDYGSTYASLEVDENRKKSRRLWILLAKGYVLSTKSKFITWKL